MRKISDLIHEFSEEWMSFLECSRKINNNKSFFVIDSQNYSILILQIELNLLSRMKDIR